jgi:hypothetical protein
MPKSGKEYHLLDLLTGESLGGFASLPACPFHIRRSIVGGETNGDRWSGLDIPSKLPAHNLTMRCRS